MKREILISATQREIRVAILEDEQLVELQVDRPENKRMVGDIYLGKVDAVQHGLQAAFVSIGTEKSAFLHNSDLAYDEEGDDDDNDDDDDAIMDIDLVADYLRHERNVNAGMPLKQIQAVKQHAGESNNVE